MLLAIIARGITEIIAFVLLGQDLIKHGHAEAGAGHELSVIYGRLGQHLTSPDEAQVKRPDNYVGRILATIFTFGIYLFWWFYNQMDEPNKHFTSNWVQEDTSSTPTHSAEPSPSTPGCSSPDYQPERRCPGSPTTRWPWEAETAGNSHCSSSGGNGREKRMR